MDPCGTAAVLCDNEEVLRKDSDSVRGLYKPMCKCMSIALAACSLHQRTRI